MNTAPNDPGSFPELPADRYRPDRQLGVGGVGTAEYMSPEQARAGSARRNRIFIRWAAFCSSFLQAFHRFKTIHYWWCYTASDASAPALKKEEGVEGWSEDESDGSGGTAAESDGETKDKVEDKCKVESAGKRKPQSEGSSVHSNTVEKRKGCKLRQESTLSETLESHTQV